MPKRSPPVEEHPSGNVNVGDAALNAFEDALKRGLSRWDEPAFLVTHEGELRAANPAGEQRLVRNGQVVRRVLAELKSESAVGWVRCIRVALDGEEMAVFALQPGEPNELAHRLRVATQRWRLTERQTETLKLLAEGCSNHEIAAALDCAVRTAEIHVGALLDKAKAKSRTGLIAAFWQLK
jgi:DNA-binding CsgD family transcriptional regulator